MPTIRNHRRLRCHTLSVEHPTWNSSLKILFHPYASPDVFPVTARPSASNLARDSIGSVMSCGCSNAAPSRCAHRPRRSKGPCWGYRGCAEVPHLRQLRQMDPSGPDVEPLLSNVMKYAVHGGCTSASQQCRRCQPGLLPGASPSPWLAAVRSRSTRRVRPEPSARPAGQGRHCRQGHIGLR